jgi:multisubunit Na+/H+ antiporter MnhE subunit
MKAYILTTGVIFGLITVAHLLRFVMEGSHLAREPVFILLTVLSAALSVWAWQVLRRLKQ